MVGHWQATPTSNNRNSHHSRLRTLATGLEWTQTDVLLPCTKQYSAVTRRRRFYLSGRLIGNRFYRGMFLPCSIAHPEWCPCSILQYRKHVLWPHQRRRSSHRTRSRVQRNVNYSGLLIYKCYKAHRDYTTKPGRRSLWVRERVQSFIEESAAKRLVLIAVCRWCGRGSCWRALVVLLECYADDDDRHGVRVEEREYAGTCLLRFQLYFTSSTGSK